MGATRGDLRFVTPLKKYLPLYHYKIHDQQSHNMWCDAGRCEKEVNYFNVSQCFALLIPQRFAIRDGFYMNETS